jgi:RHS repeat-associated protein
LTGIDNHLGLLEKVTLVGGKQIVYLYDAAACPDLRGGTKLAQVLREPFTADVRTDYVGEFVYQSGVLEFFAQPEGRCVAGGTGFRFEYHYRDHLGNLRLAFSDLDGDGDAEVSEVLQEAAYYPYGMKHEGLAAPAVGVPHRFLFQGKELEGTFGVDWMDFGARRYDAAVGRWWGVDSYALKYAGLSPYAAFGDDPLRFVDPGGESLKIAAGLEDWFYGTYYTTVSEIDRSRIDQLANSDMTYNVLFGKATGRNDAESGFNFASGQFDITIDGAVKGKDPFNIIPTLGDELQHAYQYETGEIGYFQNIAGAISSFGYDVDDEIESQEGAWRAMNAFILKANPNFDPSSKDDRWAEFAKYNPNFMTKGKIDNGSANSGFLYFRMVKQGGMNAGEWLFAADGGNYKRSSFAYGQMQLGVKTTDFSAHLKVGDLLGGKPIRSYSYRVPQGNGYENVQVK